MLTRTNGSEFSVLTILAALTQEKKIIAPSDCTLNTSTHYFKNQLEMHFPNAMYLTEQFNVAIKNETIRNAFHRAVPNELHKKTMQRDARFSKDIKQTETTSIHSIMTNEGKTLIIIEWIEEQNKNNKLSIENNFKQNTWQTSLFLSEYEIVFMPPTINVSTPDEKFYHDGMRVLYGPPSIGLQGLVNMKVITEVAKHPELVKKLGIYYNENEAFGKVELAFSPGEIKISYPENNKMLTHVFNNYYSNRFISIINFLIYYQTPIFASSVRYETYCHEIKEVSRNNVKLIPHLKQFFTIQ